MKKNFYSQLILLALLSNSFIFSISDQTSHNSYSWLKIGTCLVTAAAAVTGYMYWQHTKKITAAQSRLTQALTNDSLSDDVTNTEVTAAIAQGASVNAPIVDASRFYCQEAVPPIALAIHAGHEKTVQTLLTAKAQVTERANEPVRCALLNDALYPIRLEKEQRENMHYALPSFRSNPRPSIQGKINGRLEENKLTSSTLNYKAPTLVWYAALKQHAEPSRARNNIFSKIFTESGQFYPGFKEELVDTLYHASHSVLKPDFNTGILEVLDTAQRRCMSHVR